MISLSGTFLKNSIFESLGLGSVFEHLGFSLAYEDVVPTHLEDAVL